MSYGFSSQRKQLKKMVRDHLNFGSNQLLVFVKINFYEFSLSFDFFYWVDLSVPICGCKNSSFVECLSQDMSRIYCDDFFDGLLIVSKTFLNSTSFGLRDSINRPIIVLMASTSFLSFF